MSRLTTSFCSSIALVAFVASCDEAPEPLGPFDGAIRADVASLPACTFTTAGMTMTLDADCKTDMTISIPDGFTLDGKNHTITAVDPMSDHFTGAVVQNDGAEAHVRKLGVTAYDLANVCDAGADRLRGIMFEGASGSITHSTVVGINQGASGCQEGNAIEVRNAPFDGTHPNTQTVEVAHNVLRAWQKTGIVANGDVDVSIHHNDVEASATQADLAANSIQLGFGGSGSITQNLVDGNQWLGASNFAASAILLFANDGGQVSQNIVSGNSDVGLWVIASPGPVTADNNKVFDSGEDGPHGDFGVVNQSPVAVPTFTNNKVRGFATPYFGVAGGGNKQIPGPSKGEPFN